jgi:serine/threonine-protein kinase
MDENYHLQTGQVLARYQIVRTIGEGGMGTVYEAFHPGLKKRFAIKTLLASIAQIPEARARFLREAEVAARINHPNVVRVTDVGTDGEMPYCWPPATTWRSSKRWTSSCRSFRP